MKSLGFELFDLCRKEPSVFFDLNKPHSLHFRRERLIIGDRSEHSLTAICIGGSPAIRCTIPNRFIWKASKLGQERENESSLFCVDINFSSFKDSTNSDEMKKRKKVEILLRIFIWSLFNNRSHFSDDSKGEASLGNIHSRGLQ